jgi:hypothetical protein
MGTINPRGDPCGCKPGAAVGVVEAVGAAEVASANIALKRFKCVMKMAEHSIIVAPYSKR